MSVQQQQYNPAELKAQIIKAPRRIQAQNQVRKTMSSTLPPISRYNIMPGTNTQNTAYMPSQRPSLSKGAPAVCSHPESPAENEWEGSDSSADQEDVADQTFRLHTKHLDQEGHDAGESVNFDSLLPTVKMVKGFKADDMAREADASIDGVPDMPCSADCGGACQRCCDEGGILAQTDLADFVGPTWEIVVTIPEPAHNIWRPSPSATCCTRTFIRKAADTL
jgi:hypothetical protein